MIANRVPFQTSRHLKRFCDNKIPFPASALEGKMSAEGIKFLQSVLTPKPVLRLTAIQHAWLTLEKNLGFVENLLKSTFKTDGYEAIQRAKDREKKEREVEDKKRLEEDLRKSGLDDSQIAILLEKDKNGAANLKRPTITRMARRYLSIETLRELQIDYTLDTVRCSSLVYRHKLTFIRIQIMS